MVEFSEIDIISFSSQAMLTPQLIAADNIAIEVLRDILSARQCQFKVIQSECAEIPASERSQKELLQILSDIGSFSGKSRAAAVPWVM